jgi:hypothetical protein
MIPYGRNELKFIRKYLCITIHVETGFSWFLHSLQQMLRWSPVSKLLLRASRNYHQTTLPNYTPPPIYCYKLLGLLQGDYSAVE